MTQKTTYLAGVFLAIAFLAAAQVQADYVKFTFGGHSTFTTNADKFADVAKGLSLTVTDNGNGGADFVFTSTWVQGTEHGGRGILMSTPGYYNNGTEPVFMLNAKDPPPGTSTLYRNIFKQGKDALDLTDIPSYGSSAIQVLTNGYTESNGDWQVSFTLDFTDNSDWGDFESLVKTTDNPFTASVHLGRLDNSSNKTDYASFITNDYVYSSGSPNSDIAPTPEPATLALMGLGLAGLGLANRRRRK